MNAWRFFLALALLPAAALLVLSGWYLRQELAAPMPAGPQEVFERQMLGAVLAALGLVTGASTVVVVLVLVRERRATLALGEEQRLLAWSLERRVHEMRHLSSEVELLAAMREIARLVNRTARFDDLIGAVLEHVGRLAEVSRVSLFLTDLGAGGAAPVARAVWRPLEGARFGADIDHADVGAALAAEAAAERRLVRVWDDEALEIAVPFTADAEVVGVIAIRRPRDPAAPEDEARARHLERSLRALLTHVALAVKKPALYDRAQTDPLTLLGTRRAFDEALARRFEQARRLGRPLALLLIDADHFKQVNDRHGHLVGDRVLAMLGQTIRRELGEACPAFRYGGEELAVLPDGAGGAGPDNAGADDEDRAAAERLRRAIAAQALPLPDGETLRVTVSIGLARLDARMSAPADLIAAADRALYRAKDAGRDRCETFSRAE